MRNSLLRFAWRLNFNQIPLLPPPHTPSSATATATSTTDRAVQVTAKKVRHCWLLRGSEGWYRGRRGHNYGHSRNDLLVEDHLFRPVKVSLQGTSSATARSVFMQQLVIPNHPDLIAAIGQLAIAHTHLELTLRYTVKTLSGLSVSEALDATRQDRASDLRKRVRRLFKEKKPTAEEECKIDSLLGRAQRLTEKRNAYLHSAWSVSALGQVEIKGEDHSWGPAPTKGQVDRVASGIASLALELNEARLHGFIRKLIGRKQT